MKLKPSESYLEWDMYIRYITKREMMQFMAKTAEESFRNKKAKEEQEYGRTT